MLRTPVWIVFITGLFMAIAFFIPRDPFPQMQTWALKWNIIVSAFALLLGMDSLVLHHMRKIQRKQDRLFSITLLVGFFITLFWGFFAWWRYQSPFRIDSTFLWLFKYIVVPMDATMFSLLAFFIASAAYRAFRARDLSSSLLLVSAGIVMLGRVPYGNWAAVPILIAFGLLLAFYFFRVFNQYEGIGRFLRIVLGVLFLAGAVVLVWPALFKSAAGAISPLASWIMNVPQMAARRGIDMGISLGGLAFSLRVLVGLERGYMR